MCGPINWSATYYVAVSCPYVIIIICYVTPYLCFFFFFKNSLLDLPMTDTANIINRRLFLRAQCVLRRKYIMQWKGLTTTGNKMYESLEARKDGKSMGYRETDRQTEKERRTSLICVSLWIIYELARTTGFAANL